MLMKEISRIVDGKRKIIKKPELLAPAGNLEKLKTAIIYGADAVFVGGKELSLRSQASNFTLEDIQEAVQFAKHRKADVHVTCNIILHQDNLHGIEEYLETLDQIGVKAIIVADPYIVKVAKRLQLNMEVHISTQLSFTNSKAIEFWREQGVDRVVLAREVSYENLKEIMKNTSVDIEYFIHGAMCVHYSGRCMLSNYYSHRDANRGGCSQSCRWNYDIYDGNIKINSSKEDAFTMSSKDLSLLKEIPELIELGVDSFKIEGRMKSVHYIATVVSTYRKLIDAYCEDPDGFVFDDFYETEILRAANRSLSTGFFHGVASREQQIFNVRDEHPTQEFVIRVVGYDKEKKLAKIEQRNYFKIGDCIEFFSPNKRHWRMTVKELYNEDFEKIEIANHPMEVLYLHVEEEVFENDMARKVA